MSGSNLTYRVSHCYLDRTFRQGQYRASRVASCNIGTLFFCLKMAYSVGKRTAVRIIPTLKMLSLLIRVKKYRLI